MADFRTSEFEEAYDAFLEGEDEAIKGEGLLSRRIHHLKPRKALALRPDDSVRKAVDAMRDARQGAVIVLQGKSLMGIFTERDVILKCLSEGANLENHAISEVMTPDPEALSMRDGIAYALNMMHLGGYRHIPVWDKAAEQWHIVSVRDIARWIVDLFPAAVLNLPPEPQVREPDLESGG